MQNVKVETTKDGMVIRIALTDETFRTAEPSSSGKTWSLASTKGNRDFTLPNGKSVTLGLNAYFKK